MNNKPPAIFPIVKGLINKNNNKQYFEPKGLHHWAIPLGIDDITTVVVVTSTLLMMHKKVKAFAKGHTTNEH